MNIFLNVTSWKDIANLCFNFSPVCFALFGMIVFIYVYVKHRKDEWPKEHYIKYWLSFTGLMVVSLYLLLLGLLIIDDAGIFEFEVGYLICRAIVPPIKMSVNAFGYLFGIIVPTVMCAIGGVCLITFSDIINEVEDTNEEESVNNITEKA